MQKKRKRRWLAASGTLLLMFIVLAYLVVGGKDSGAVHADPGITTEQSAAKAGARILSTDPKLKVEPK